MNLRTSYTPYNHTATNRNATTNTNFGRKTFLVRTGEFNTLLSSLSAKKCTSRPLDNGGEGGVFEFFNEAGKQTLRITVHRHHEQCRVNIHGYPPHSDEAIANENGALKMIRDILKISNRTLRDSWRRFSDNFPQQNK